MDANDEKWALVTGASSGIGRAVAEALAERGFGVVCAARRVDRLAELARALGNRAIAIDLDLRDPASATTLVERLPAASRNLSVLVNCAGHDVGGRRRFDRGEMEEWANVVETNLLGTMRVTHAVVRGMVERGRGHVVNVGSIFGFEAHAGGAAYTASKFGLNGFSKAILADYRGKGIRVTQVIPGLTRTEFAETRWAGDKAKASEFYGKFPSALEPADVARVVLFAVEQPPHVTISDLTVLPSS